MQVCTKAALHQLGRSDIGGSTNRGALARFVAKGSSCWRMEEGRPAFSQACRAPRREGGPVNGVAAAWHWDNPAWPSPRRSPPPAVGFLWRRH